MDTVYYAHARGAIRDTRCIWTLALGDSHFSTRPLEFSQGAILPSHREGERTSQSSSSGVKVVYGNADSGNPSLHVL